MTAVSWLIGPRATEILHGDAAAGGTTNNSAGATRESRFSIGGSDDDEDDDDAASERVPMRHPTAIVSTLALFISEAINCVLTL